jgi:ligand-binding sensor domain-containing protein
MKTFFTVILFILFAKISVSQQPYTISYTTSDGLPSNEIYSVFQDRMGYMWITTDRGVSRFNGYTFKNYAINDGLEKLEINIIKEDNLGKIWVSSYFGGLYYFDNGKFHAYKYNNILKDYNKNRLVDLISISDDSTFYFNNIRSHFYSINKNGQVIFYKPECDNCYYLSNTNTKNYMLGSSSNKSNLSENLPLFFFNNHKKIDLKKIIRSDIILHLFQKQNKIVIASDKQLLRIENGHISAEYPIPKGTGVNNLIIMQNDLYVYKNKGYGLEIHRDWIINGFSKNPETWLENINVSSCILDRNGGLWITTLGDGLRYMPNPKVPIFSPQENITTISMLGENILLGTTKGNISKVVGNEIEDFTSTGKYCYDLIIDEQNKVLYTKPLIINLTSKKIDIDILKYGIPTLKDKKRKFNDSDLANLGFMTTYDKETKRFNTIRNTNLNFKRIFDLLRDISNTLWLATDAGIKQYSNTEYLNVSWHPILNKHRVNAVDQLSSGEMVFGLKGFGVFIGTKNKLSHLTIKDGLSSDLINYIWVDSKNNIWVATNNGLNKIKKLNEKYIIKQFHTSDGLPSEEINKILINNDDVWLATNQGLCRWKDQTIDSFVQRPMISKITVNGKEVQKIGKLKHDDNDISLRFINLDYNQASKVQYRYKFENEAWQNMTSNELELINVKPDQYNLQVQAQNKDGYWSDALSVQFSIENILYKKPWFIATGLLGLFSLLYSQHRKRVQNAIAKEAINSKIKDLEKKAAYAQFNPHFIFNASSTIQYYIAIKDLENAEKYLVDFTNILRGNMESMEKKFVLLSDEITHIKNYVELEQKRVDHKFCYQINIDEAIDPLVTQVPSLLLFSLCDEAINQRLMHRMDNNGQLLINLISDKDALIIEVNDNGTKSSGTMNLNNSKTTFLDRIEYYKYNGSFDIEYNFETTNKDSPCNILNSQKVRIGKYNKES